MNFIPPTLDIQQVETSWEHTVKVPYYIYGFFLLGGKTKEDTDFYLVWSKMLDSPQS